MLEIALVAIAIGYICRLAASRGASKLLWGLGAGVAYVVSGLIGGTAAVAIFGPFGSREAARGPYMLGYLVFGVSAALLIRFALLRMKQVAPMDGGRRVDYEGAELLAADISTSCSRCRHGTPKTDRMILCTVRDKIVLWNATCDEFEEAV